MPSRHRPAKKNRPQGFHLHLETLEDRAVPNATYHDLSSGNFTQDWADPDLITTTDDWSSVPSIIGYRGDGLSNSTSTDPQDVLGESTVVNVIAGSTANASAGGVHEIEASQTIALQGSGTADAPHIVIHLNTTGLKNIVISYTLKELDSTTVNQKFALQYRVGESGDYTNVPAGAVSGVFDTSGNQTQNVSVLLPSAVNNQSKVQVRVITNDAPSSDAMVGVDDIVVRVAELTPSVTNANTNEDTQSTSGLVVSKNSNDGGATTHVKITNVTNGTLFLSDGTTAISNGDFITLAQAGAGLKFTPSSNFSGTGSFQAQGSTSNSDAGLGGSTVTATITVSPVADTPSVTSTTTNEDTQTTSGLVISKNAADDTEVTHVKITNVTNGTLFLSDGTTAIGNGTFITIAQAGAGLKFTPATDFVGTGSFDVQASLSASDAGLGGNVVTATITVDPVNDAPTFALASTNVPTSEDGGAYQQTNFVVSFSPGGGSDEATQTAAGYSVSADLKSLFSIQPAISKDGTLTFEAAPNAFGTATIEVTVTDSAGATSDVQKFTITVSPVADTPSVTDASTDANAPTSGGLVITPNKVDADTVTHFLITNIKNGSLFLADGKTAVPDNTLIPVADGLAGLVFAPNTNFVGKGTFDVRASIAGTGVGGATVTATITVRPLLTPTVTGASTSEDALTAGGLVITPNAADGGATAFYQITDITGGTLFVKGAAVTGGSYISAADGASLTFLSFQDLNDATTGFFGFSVQAATSAGGAGLAGNVVTATITVTPVNDRPTVTVPAAVVVAQDSGSYLQTNFATFAPGGGADEATQTAVSYGVSNTNNALFSTQPAIDANGTLTFTLAPGASGSATVTVRVTDSGPGTAPNLNVSQDATFTITVTPAAVAPSAPPSATPPALAAASSQIVVIGSDTGTVGRVRVMDAKTGVTLYDLTPFAGFTGGVEVAVGDVNGDGIDDVIVATASGGSHVKVYDGATRSEIRSFIAFPGFTGGVSLAAGDVDRDGRADIVVGTATGSSHVKVFSGQTGAEIRSFLAFDGFLGGVRVAAGDVNGDGAADVAVVAGPGGSGHVKVFDGTSAALLASFLGYPGYLGEINLAVGDVTGDDRAEIITTAANAQFGTHVKAVDASGAEVRSFFAPAPQGATTGFGRTDLFVFVPTRPARAGAGDVNGDNVAEILLSTNTNRAQLLNSATGALMSQFDFDPILGLGVFVDV